MTFTQLLEDLFREEIVIHIRNGHIHYDDPHHALRAEQKIQLDRFEALVLSELETPETQGLPIYPLSSVQKTLWFLYQRAPHSVAYNVKFDAHMFSKIDIPAFQRALQGLVDRHPSLRTIYPIIDGEPVQQIRPHQELSFEVIDAGHWSRERLNQELYERAELSFDVVRGPLLRAYLFTLPKGRSIFWLLVHHIAVDFWSMEILLDEFGKFYEAERSGRPAALQPLGQQYIDYMQWKLKMLGSERGEGHREYFQQRFGDELPVLHLPTDRPRPPVQTYETDSLSFRLDPELVEQLKELAHIERSTVPAILLAAYYVLLYRYSGQEDIIIGMPAGEQGHRLFKGVVGFFENPLPLRIDLSGNPDVRSLIRQVHQTLWNAQDHADFPSHFLRSRHRQHTDPSHPSLFQTIFIFQEQHQHKNIAPFLLGQGGERIELGDLVMVSMGLEEQTMIFVDVQLTILEDEDALSAYWQYNTDLFDEATLERMGEHYQALLEAMIEDPEQTIAELPLMSAAEEHQILVEWNKSGAEYPKDRCIHQLFEAQVERSPNAVAVVFEGRQLTYGELNALANRLARYLQKHGVGPEVLVAMYMERSLEIIVGILGILKAGGAYVPIDCVYPRERVAFMLDDCQAPVILTQSHLVKELPECEARIICLDTDWEAIAEKDATTPESEVLADNVVYSIYTSGSTGKPKGALITHDNVARLFKATESWFHFTHDDVWTLFHSYAFDFSVWEIWGALLYGGKLIIVPYEVSRSPEAFYQLLRTNGVTILNQTPSAFRQLMQAEEALNVSDALSLRLIIFGGEALDIQSLKPWFERHGDVCPQLVNMYGITETTVHVTYRPLTISDTEAATGSVIGIPIPDLQVYVLDRLMQPVPIGVPGEMYIGGCGVARGYLKREQLTEERFLPDLFRPSPHTRLYKTGDLARFLPNGDLEYLGRIDHQVKIRGFRIELGEIETSINGHPAVRESVVLVRQDTMQENRLVAYLVPDTVQVPDENLTSPGVQGEYISQWQNVYNDTYQHSSSEQAVIFNIIGWNSSYTNQPLPETDMREWVKTTVKRIETLQPQRVLEIGCGTGLLLFRIAPSCKRYLGIDFSESALETIRQTLSRQGGALAQVELLRRTANNLEDIPAESFTTVILNSVIQYFPTVEYLLQVLEGAIHSLSSEGGTIFVGDIRSYPLLELFHTSVQFYQAAPVFSKEQLRHRIQRRIGHENELVLSPEFFLALKQHFPQINRVRILPKRGRAENEMTRFRYDAVLSVNTGPTTPVETERLEWHRDNLSLPAIRRQLEEQNPEALSVVHIPNARLSRELRIAAWLHGDEGPATVGELRETLAHAQEGIPPEELWILGEELSYRVELSWARSDSNGSYDVLFVRHDVNGDVGIHDGLPVFHEDALQHKAWSAYATNPLHNKQTQSLIPKLRKHLEERLPDYMIPSAFVLLRALPLTPNGKIDRKALPDPERARPELETEFVAPRSDVEEALADLWQETLDLEQVGVYDDFFALGGDSLIATRLATRVREVFELDLSIASLFEVHTIAELSIIIEEHLLAEIEALSDEEVQQLMQKEG